MTTNSDFQRVLDISEIARLLAGKVEFSEIKWSQVLPVNHGESVNDLLFVDKKWGIYFYTSKSDFDNICYLSDKKLPTMAVHSGSKNVYLLSK